MARHSRRPGASGPSQRQLRAGELIRHALVDILAQEELRDADLQGVSVTIGEVRCSPDLKHATIFCTPLGDTDPDARARVTAALNRASRFIRGRLGREIDMKFTPDLRFISDESYNEAQHISDLLASDRVRRDLDED
ncbi:MAG: 30S ribosome-binding factor RbfA [Alphaproteobacteria bacterium]|jgi:ribosome-binding factor A|nr:30S ribosome-binding factor RbfA [Alphaproteobacteria bacterium]